MSEIDRQRITAVRKLRELGYRFFRGEWVTDASDPMIAVGDGCYRMIVKRPDVLADRPDSPREGEPVIAWEWIAGSYATVPPGDGFYRLLMYRDKELSARVAQLEAGVQKEDAILESGSIAYMASSFALDWENDDRGWFLRTSSECYGPLP